VGFCSQRIEKKRNQGEAARGRRKRRARVFAAPRMRNKRGGGGGGAVVGRGGPCAVVHGRGKKSSRCQREGEKTTAECLHAKRYRAKKGAGMEGWAAVVLTWATEKRGVKEEGRWARERGPG
jgi:hypothetical protein